MAEIPAVSVLMSVYNGERYLQEAIESILAQTFANFEFIIINDGSTDTSQDIIEQYQKLDPRIIVTNTENRGLPASLNQGLSQSRGKYVARMDADDISLPTRLEEQYEYMEQDQGVGICGTWAEAFKDQKKLKVMKYAEAHSELLVTLLFSVCFAHPTVMIRKNILTQYNLSYNPLYESAQDYELWERLSHVTRFSNLQKSLLRYRVNPDGITTKVEDDKCDLRYRLISGVFSKILDRLSINNTDEENKLHFALGLNSRLKARDIDLDNLSRYLKKIVLSNNKMKYLNADFLVKVISKKFLVALYYHHRRCNLITIFRLTTYYMCIYMYAVIKCKLKRIKYANTNNYVKS